MSGGDVALIEAALAAWDGGDVDKMREWIDPDIEWRPGTDSPSAGLHTGFDGFARYARSWAAIAAVVTHAWRVRDGKTVQWFSFADEFEALSFLEQHP